MDITTEGRASGLYVIQQTGMQKWADGGQVWQAHGVRLDLMDGTRHLALCKIEAPQHEADKRARTVADGIEPWAPALLWLIEVRQARSQMTQLITLTSSAAEADEQGWPVEEYVRDHLAALATPDEIAEARRSPALEWEGLPLARIITPRLRSALTARHLALLAAAPDVTTHPIHPAWEQPSALWLVSGVSTAQTMASELLAAWAAARDLRDPLITWAVRDAEVTRTQVQQTTGVSRSTINRLLPE
ncbi:hypothetical protein ACWD3J_13670 [Streptomyces sp. NPDC002755]